MMVTRHMKEFGTTVEQMAAVSVKNHLNAYHNPYAQKRNRYSIEDVRTFTDGSMAVDPPGYMRHVGWGGSNHPGI
jgi:acetyl-CoA acetyltransferase